MVFISVLLVKDNSGEEVRFLVRDTYKGEDCRVFGRPAQDDRDRFQPFLRLTFMSEEDMKRAGYGHQPVDGVYDVNPAAFSGRQRREEELGAALSD